MTTRERILDAAERVFRARGLARATTRDIADAAACSEGTLYNHFRNKEDIYFSVMRERLPPFVNVVLELPERAGSGTVRETLEHVARLALQFYSQSLPLTVSLFSEPAMLERHRERLRTLRGGPHKPAEALADYLRAEQRLGRISANAEPQAAAEMLLAVCLQQAFNRQFVDDELLQRDEPLITGVLATLVAALGAA